MGLLSKLSGVDKEERAMADVTRQVLAIVGMGRQQGVVTINTLKFPGSGTPELIIERVKQYLITNGVALLNLNHSPWAYTVAFQVEITGAFNVSTFGQQYEKYLQG